MKWRKRIKNPDNNKVRLTEVDVEGAPLLGAGMKVSPFHVKISGTNRLGTQTVE